MEKGEGGDSLKHEFALIDTFERGGDEGGWHDN